MACRLCKLSRSVLQYLGTLGSGARVSKVLLALLFSYVSAQNTNHESWQFCKSILVTERLRLLYVEERERVRILARETDRTDRRVSSSFVVSVKLIHRKESESTTFSMFRVCREPSVTYRVALFPTVPSCETIMSRLATKERGGVDEGTKCR